jgi:hypothetical protein
MEVFTSVPKLRVWERTCKVEALLRGGAAGLEVFRVAAIHDSQTDPASCALLADGWDSYAVSVVAQFETVPEGPQKLAGGAAAAKPPDDPWKTEPAPDGAREA